MSNNTRPTTPINDLYISAACPKNINYQEILTSMIRFPKLPQILKKAKISLADVSFITFQQFLQRNQITELSNDYFDRNDYFQRYQTELQRRIRQLEILLEMQRSYFQKPYKNTSAQKSSRCKIETPKHKKYQDISNRIEKQLSKDRKAVKFTSQSHKYEFNHHNSRKSSLSYRRNSLVTSRYSRQHSHNRIKTHNNIKQVEIYQAYTEGRPYIEQYYNQLKQKVKSSDNQKLKTMPSQTRNKLSRKVSKAGKIKKQIIQTNKSFQNQYQNSLSNRNHKKQGQHADKATRKSTKREYQDNQYAMIPMKNEKIKQRLTRKKSRNFEKETCRQLVTQVKKYEEINQNYIKKLKSIEKNDRKSREKLFEASSRDKLERKKHIEHLKNRISSKSSRKQTRF